MRKTFAALLVLVLAGCSTPTVELEPQWEPLERIKQSKVMTLGGFTRTVHETVYVKDLKKWLADHPEPLYTSIMKHEQIHAKRQAEEGLFTWLRKYATDKKFMWEEEQLGWYEELIWAKGHGAIINVDKLAKRMSEYKNLEGSMVSEGEAKAWINDVLSGKWKPQK